MNQIHVHAIPDSNLVRIVPSDRVMTLHEAADVLGRSARTLREMKLAPHLEVVTHGLDDKQRALFDTVSSYAMVYCEPETVQALYEKHVLANLQPSK